MQLLTTTASYGALHESNYLQLDAKLSRQHVLKTDIEKCYADVRLCNEP
jgi:hypothetical protein